MIHNSISIRTDHKGHQVAVINDILFTGKKNIAWNEVEKYLKQYIGCIIEVASTKELIHIGADFPDEFKGSEDTMSVRGGNAKAKANSVQGLPEMIHISKKISETQNIKPKNEHKAQNGWYRYLTRFALPMFKSSQVISHYNVYLATLIVRVNKLGQLYLYDIINIKKEGLLDIKE